MSPGKAASHLRRAAFTYTMADLTIRKLPRSFLHVEIRVAPPTLVSFSWVFQPSSNYTNAGLHRSR